MRAALPIVCLAVLAGCAQLRPPRNVRVYKPTSVKDAKGASQAVENWRSTLGFKKFAKVAKATQTMHAGSITPGAASDWMVRAVDDKGQNWSFIVSEKSGRILMAQREVKFMAMTSSTTGSGKKYTRGEDAMKDISDMCAPLVAGREVTLTSFDMGAAYAPTSMISSRAMYFMFGNGMRAHYSVLAHGRPFLTGDYGIDVEIDPATGEITQYFESLDTPSTGSPIPLVLPETAILMAEKTAGVKVGTFAKATPILGWAVPTGGREARLFYMVDGSDGTISYPPVFISAETGTVDKGLGASLRKTPGSSSYFLSGMRGGVHLYRSSTPAAPVKPKVKKP